MPRLIFSESNHLNTDISDEQGHKLYTISTPWAFGNKVTTITKYIWSGSTGLPQTLGIIEWHSFTGAVIHFQGKVTNADAMLNKQAWQSGRYFLGPDKKTYKWKISPRCWLKPADSHRELARFHQKNLGFLNESHSPYLDVSSEAVPMLDHIILTFVYVEKLRRDQATNNRTNMNNMNNINAINNMNAINAMNNMNNMTTMNNMSTMC